MNFKLKLQGPLSVLEEVPFVGWFVARQPEAFKEKVGGLLGLQVDLADTPGVFEQRTRPKLLENCIQQNLQDQGVYWE